MGKIKTDGYIPTGAMTYGAWGLGCQNITPKTSWRGLRVFRPRLDIARDNKTPLIARRQSGPLGQQGVKTYEIFIYHGPVYISPRNVCVLEYKICDLYLAAAVVYDVSRDERHKL